MPCLLQIPLIVLGVVKIAAICPIRTISSAMEIVFYSKC